MKCEVCQEIVEQSVVEEEFDYLFEQVDFLGEQSLTENEQVLYAGKICSSKCFEDFKDIVA